MTVPYTYRIGWTNLDKYYYGVRYAKGCAPEELWVKYKTSSKHVEKFAAKHGDPDLIEVRKIFDDSNKARDWENKAIRRAGLVDNKYYLNYTNNKAIPVVKFDRIKNLTNRKKFDEFDEETKSRIRKQSSEFAKNMHASGMIRYEKPEDTTNYKIAAKKRWSDPSFKEKFIGQKWMHHKGTTKKISPDEWNHYQEMGWSFGRGGY
jgi:hypothetical protein